VVPSAEFDSGLFSKEELHVLEAVATRFKDCTASGMSTCSHAEDGYSHTQMKDSISYSYAESLPAIH